MIYSKTLEWLDAGQAAWVPAEDRAITGSNAKQNAAAEPDTDNTVYY